MEPRVLARAGAIVLVVLMLAAAWITFTRHGDLATPDTNTSPAEVTSPRAELLHCSEMGQAALTDETCQRVWADSRRHFLAGHPATPPGGSELPSTGSPSSLSPGSLP